ncbi:Metalloenzyme, LuxS/M16 peptidase-like protein [Lipomyces tetrasporus]|uniref:Metalloenzyme, LuxS/M16 peptidase-like protein n=1 Tax=Lipomyces tetrasporus TaxID=54092 RepID=A0AAD7QSF1_9ASCO|nr:Metalloenzyme, LuxS/M16 peptidase-like protein [Lipomyces tetrasporus]KAJ8100603.1 Metalloenzyme, LuxS/M16 peptidase-like protein [Lipomyces tetrasporus]
MIARFRALLVSRNCYYWATTATVATSISFFACSPLGQSYCTSKVGFARFYNSFTSSSYITKMFQTPLSSGGGLVPESQAFEVVATNLERPEIDNRSYRVIRLANELEALLIHDPDTDKSSAALDVRVGSFSDPKDLQGLAHFCEHLLFMGTEKYPKENEYSEYLASHSGHSNAYTDTKETNYYFEVDHEYLDGALDRFAQFFISPLFLPDCKDREIRAVDSENKKNLQSDTWRLYQLERSLSNPEHPYSNFSTGNMETLDVIPTSKGLDVREELLKFHEKYYSANVMKLVILGREPLEKLEEWTVEKFSLVRNAKISVPTFPGAPFTEKELQKQIYAKPVMDDKYIELTFPFPDQRPLFRSHPGNYYSHLIGHEGPGSILQYLKGKSWANSLSAGTSHISEGYDVFQISVDLTPDGIKNYEEVIVTIFQYLKLLQDTPPQRWIYDELRDVAEASFRFRQKSPASSTTSRLAAIMQRPMPRDWILSGTSLYREFDEKAIAESAMYFSPDTFRCMLVSQDYPGGWDQKEQWYGTEYKIESISQSLLARIRKAPLSDHLHLPAKNEFIATNFDVDKKEVESPAKNPTLVKDAQGLRLWYKKDDTFWVPKSHVQIHLRNPITSASPENKVASRIFLDLVIDKLSAYAYAASIAGLSYTVRQTSDGTFIGIAGYNHKLDILLKKILEEIRDFKVDQERFAVMKEKAQRDAKNWHYGNPYYQIGYYTSYLFAENMFLSEETLPELDALTPQAVQEFVPRMLSQFDTEVLVLGNALKEDALNIAKLVDETLKHKSLPASLGIRQRSLILPEASSFAYKRQLLDEKNINSCIEYFCQVGDLTNKRQRATLGLLGQIASEPAFNQLRTKEQLGYVVFSGVRNTKTLDGLRVLVQSERTTEYVETRIDAFFDSLGKLIKDMSDEDYEKHVKSLVLKRKEKLKNLGEEVARYWNQIENGYYDFSRYDEEAEILPTIGKDDVLDLFYTFVHPSSRSRSKAVVHLQSQCPPPLPTLSDALKSKLGEFAKLNNLSAEDLISEDQLTELSTRDDPLTALMEFFTERNMTDLWESQAKDIIAEQIKVTTPPGVNEDSMVIDDVTAFKASLKVSAAPTPVQDLALFRELDSKL